ncbi:Uncharacterized protein Rs2_13383 [Raphanus sativus]|nr:Uncharacterized protein Rs2_13383 [Raphanus sativus]
MTNYMLQDDEKESEVTFSYSLPVGPFREPSQPRHGTAVESRNKSDVVLKKVTCKIFRKLHLKMMRWFRFPEKSMESAVSALVPVLPYVPVSPDAGDLLDYDRTESRRPERGNHYRGYYGSSGLSAKLIHLMVLWLVVVVVLHMECVVVIHLGSVAVLGEIISSLIFGYTAFSYVSLKNNIRKAVRYCSEYPKGRRVNEDSQVKLFCDSIKRSNLKYDMLPLVAGADGGGAASFGS